MSKIELNFTQAKLDIFVESTCANHPKPEEYKNLTDIQWTKKYWIELMKRDNLMYRKDKAGSSEQIDNDLIT